MQLNWFVVIALTLSALGIVLTVAAPAYTLVNLFTRPRWVRRSWWFISTLWLGAALVDTYVALLYGAAWLAQQVGPHWR